MKNKKGFTLVELLVAITILGIIIVIAIPLIRNVTGNQVKQKYKTYRSSIEQSARLYVDTYGKDEFGNNENGCIVIKLSDLIKLDLAKDIQVDNASCKTDNSYVMVKKEGKRYTYTTYLSCGEKNADDTIVVDTSMTDNGPSFSEAQDSCNVKRQETVKMDIKFTPSSYPALNAKRTKIEIDVSSLTGINKNSKISYAFTSEKNPTPKWNNLSLNISGNTAKAVILTPEDTTDIIYLNINSKNLSDASGTAVELNPIGSPDCVKVNNSNVKCGGYIVDNQEPKFNNETKPVLGGEKFSDSKLDVKATDTYSTESSVGGTVDNLRLCLELNKSPKKCGKNPDVIAEQELGYETYGTIKENEKAKLNDYLNGYDNIEGITGAKIYIADLAGNVASKDFTINKLTYDMNGGAGCDPFKYSFNGVEWGKLCEPSSNIEGISFKHWNTKKDNSGTDIDENSVANSDLKVYAIWQKAVGTLSVTLNPTVYTYDGREKRPTVTVKDGNTTLVEGTDYTVSYSNNINAGTATATVTGKNAYNATTKVYYTGNKTANFTINRKAIEFPTCQTKTYNGNSQTLFSAHTSGEYTNNVLNGTNAGEHYVALTPTSNYKWSNGNNVEGARTLTCVIEQRTVTVTAPKVVSQTLTYNGTNQNLLSSSGSCTAGGTMYWYSNNATTSSTAPAFSTSTWTKTAPTAYNKKNAGTYYIYYYCLVSDTNNNKGSNINTVKSVNKSINRKSVAFPTCQPKEYTGNQQTLFSAHTSGEYTNSALTGTDAGKYNVTLTPTSNYKWSSGTNVESARTLTCEITQSQERIGENGEGGWRCNIADGNWYYILTCGKGDNGKCYYDTSNADRAPKKDLWNLTSNGNIIRKDLRTARYCRCYESKDEDKASNCKTLYTCRNSITTGHKIRTLKYNATGDNTVYFTKLFSPVYLWGEAVTEGTNPIALYIVYYDKTTSNVETGSYNNYPGLEGNASMKNYAYVRASCFSETPTECTNSDCPSR